MTTPIPTLLTVASSYLRGRREPSNIRHPQQQQQQQQATVVITLNSKVITLIIIIFSLFFEAYDVSYSVFGCHVGGNHC